MLYNAVIFDLDGTLTDSGEGIFACARYALEKMGRLAAEYLIRKNRDRTSLPIHLVFETSLVINGCKFLP